MSATSSLGRGLAVTGAALGLWSTAACGSPSSPIDNHGSADDTVRQIMDRLEHGDMTAGANVMTPLCNTNERNFGWLAHPPHVTDYQIARDAREDPANNAAGPQYLESDRVYVSYTVSDGDVPYEGSTDGLLMARAPDGSWWLAERGGEG